MIICSTTVKMTEEHLFKLHMPQGILSLEYSIIKLYKPVAPNHTSKRVAVYFFFATTTQSFERKWGRGNFIQKNIENSGRLMTSTNLITKKVK